MRAFTLQSFSGNGSTNNGTVHIVDIGAPTYPNYVTELSPIHQFTIPSEIFATIYEPESQLFLCATNKGLVGFTKEYDVVMFNLPGKSLQGTACYDEENLVDSVQNVCNGFIAVKCALHGKIYIFNMNSITSGLRNVLAASDNSPLKLKPALTLNWSQTDNYFMSISYNPHSQLLFCGDDEGCIWIYSLPAELLQSGGGAGKMLDPVQILSWPEVIDRHALGSKKINLDVYDIVVNKVVMHPRGAYLISSTSNNYVCVWRNETMVE
ncbi:leucine-rich repeat and WD repeat-containing protein 1-like [Diaphorina citri]|uniref:Leucine-rich repeat and WD repeat-containing protein 1-like n=1 Tax=Diaphorina citri TaxID=121845 RepID=A0A3Q0JER4_DIACI|nr:leucine-rich repeat and WD repeat-containing protein 1-like [Diaphorina citri]